MDIVHKALLVALGIILGGAITVASYWAHQPHCPTEDSCVVDYYDGHWHVAEVHS